MTPLPASFSPPVVTNASIPEYVTTRLDEGREKKKKETKQNKDSAAKITLTHVWQQVSLPPAQTLPDAFSHV